MSYVWFIFSTYYTELISSSLELKENNPGLDNIFIDKKSEKQFRLFKYFDYEVIQDVETGWINAGGFVRDVGNLLGKNVDLYDFKTNEDYQFCVEYINSNIDREIPINMNDEVSYYLNKGFERKLKGSYVPFRVFQLIALWADKKHKLAILEQINTYANLINKSAYEVLNNINDQLKAEISKLKQEKSDLEDEVLEQTLNKEFLSYDNSKLQALIINSSVSHTCKEKV